MSWQSQALAAQGNCGGLIAGWPQVRSVEMDNTSTLVMRLKARAEELRRVLAAADANRAELQKIESMLAAAGET